DPSRCAHLLSNARDYHHAPPWDLRFLVPDVEEGVVAGGRDRAAAFSSGTIERRPHLLLALLQLRQGDFDGDAGFDLIEVRQDLRDDRLVLAVAAVRHISRPHRFEIHRRMPAVWRHTRALIRIIKRYVNVT